MDGLDGLEYWTSQPKIISAGGFTIPQGPVSANRIPLLKRAVVLALNWHVGLGFGVVAIKVHVTVILGPWM